MSKVTPVEEPELSVNENPHIHIHLHSVGEFMPTISQLDKTSNQKVFENMPHKSNYVEHDGKKLGVSTGDSIPDEYIYEVPIDKEKPSRKYYYKEQIPHRAVMLSELSYTMLICY